MAKWPRQEQLGSARARLSKWYAGQAEARQEVAVEEETLTGQFQTSTCEGISLLPSSASTSCPLSSLAEVGLQSESLKRRCSVQP